MDFWTSVYQFICFPAYGIPKVRRSDYIILDRHKLRYLNSIERLNCAYCGYVNGVIAYVQEVAGRTEQHWCPIKHAVRVKHMHSLYQHFLDYGDAEQYRKRIEEVRRDFEDLKKEIILAGGRGCYFQSRKAETAVSSWHNLSGMVIYGRHPVCHMF